MSHSYEISVFVTCFNKGPFIEAALESLITQQCAPSFELIILDDASTDDSWDKIQSFANKNTTTDIWISRNEQNMGLASGMTYGLSVASGRYFCRFDGDDIWYPNALMKMYMAAENCNSISAFGEVDLIDSRNEITKPYPNIMVPQEEYLSSWHQKILRRNFINGAAFIARTSAWKSALPIPKGINATIDWYFNISILSKNSVTRIESPLAAYRIHEGNLHSTSLLSGKKLETWLVLRDQFLLNPSSSLSKEIAQKIRVGCELELLLQFLGSGMYDMARGCVRRIMMDGDFHALFQNLKHVTHAIAPRLYNGVKAALKLSKP